jgi:hypothetical protein
MAVTIKEVKNKGDRKAFVKLQFSLYNGNNNWAPPIINDEIKAITPELNPASDFCKMKYWLAYKDGKIAGRIGAIINDLYNKKMNEKRGRFNRFECINDKEVAHKLLDTAENWIREQGMEGIHGPLGTTNLDTQGMLIEGFDHLQSVASVYHLPYYKEFIESYGYEKENDWIEFRLTVDDKIFKKVDRGASLIKKRFGIEVIHFKKTSELIPYSNTIFDILNNAFQDLHYVVELNEKMKEVYKKKYLKMLNPEFVKIVKMKDELIGFVIGMPSLSLAMQKANGKLFPFGFYHLMKALKGKGDTADQLLTGVFKENQATGAAVVLMDELQKAMHSKGMKYIETTGIFEDNQSAIGNWKSYEYIQHKRRRCFKKDF